MLLCGIENCRQAPLIPEARNRSEIGVCGRGLCHLGNFNSSASSVLLWIRMSVREQNN